MKRFGSMALAAMVAIGGCGDETNKGDPDGTNDPDGNTEVNGDGDEVNNDPWAAPTESGNWQVIYGNRLRPGQTPPQGFQDNDLWLMDSDGANLRTLTSFGDLEQTDPPLTCNYGCFVSPDMKWIAVVAGPPTSTGFTLRLGQFDSGMKVSLLKGAEIADIIDFQFVADRMFYSKIATCAGGACEYAFSVVELQENVNLPIPFETYPKGEDLAGSTYKGHFRVGDNGRSMVMLNTTIRSVLVSMWKEGTGIVKLDFICKFGGQGNCQGTGSEYTDTDPVAIDPTGRYVAFFTSADRWQRIHLYDTLGGVTGTSSIVAEVDSGGYVENACKDGVLADWQWRRVVSDAYFTPDGSEIVFIGENDCPVNGAQPDKPRANIYRIKVATLLSGKTLEEGDVFDVTKSPFGDVTLNRRPSAFQISPDGATIVFTGTTSYDSGGSLIADGGSRQRSDREVYRIRLDGTNIEQLTNQIQFTAESPMIIRP